MNKKLVNFVFVCAFIFIWYLFSKFNIFNGLLLPGPQKVFASFLNLFANGFIIPDLMASLYRIVLGFGLGVFFGVLGGIIIGKSRISGGFECIIDFFRSIPAPALIPIFLLLFGIGNSAKIALTTFLVCLWMAVHTSYGIKNGNHERILVAKIIGLSRIKILLHLTIPEALPHISAGIRSSISLSLILTILTEIVIGADKGLGQRVIDYQLFYKISDMYAVILLTGLLGFIFNTSFLMLEKRLIHWKND